MAISDADRLTISATFEFAACTLGVNQFDGVVDVFLHGDHPSRKGGQVGEVLIVFNRMQLAVASPNATMHTLTGEFRNRSGFGAASIDYYHEYKTTSYTHSSATSEYTITDAEYIQTLKSDYNPADQKYYRLSEVGRLSLVDRTNSLNSYTIVIEPELVYNSQLNANENPVYGNTLDSGVINYALSNGDAVIASVDLTDTTLISYNITANGQNVSITDAWLTPVPCDDNSALNNRNLCSSRL